MPGGDKSGPMGNGPMTGRGTGFCNGNKQESYRVRRSGRGRNFGFERNIDFPGGFGKNFCNNFFDRNFNNTPFKDDERLDLDEKELLLSQAKVLKEQLDKVNSRIESLNIKNDNEE